MTQSYADKLQSEAVKARVGELVREGRTMYYATMTGGLHFEHRDYAEVAAMVEMDIRHAAGPFPIAQS